MSIKKGLFGFLKELVSPTLPSAAASTTTLTLDPITHYTPTSTPTSTPSAPVSQEVIQYVCTKLEEILSISGFGGKLEFQKQENDRLFFEITNPQDVGRIIGKDGMTLEALQTLVKAFIFKKYGATAKIALDIENYRQKREDLLRAHALKSAKTVLTRSRKIDLKPMNPEERRLIHSLFQDDKRIRSYSVGSGVYRHVVLERRGPKQDPALD